MLMARRVNKFNLLVDANQVKADDGQIRFRLQPRFGLAPVKYSPLGIPARPNFFPLSTPIIFDTI